MSGLRERLGELARSRRNGDTPVPQTAFAERKVTEARSRALGVEAYLPGGEWRDDRGAVYIHERLRSEIERPRSHWGRLRAPPEEESALCALAAMGLGRALFLDLETGGFSASPVFLAGTMHWNGSDFVLRQYFARHYGEEAALLSALDRQVRDFEALVTFNGKSYDAPFLRERALVHGVPLTLPGLHVDLLHAARRRWKNTLRDCRLQTLELWVCRRRRAGDVPSDEVPALYHDYVRRGDPYRLIPVFHHNMLDVITMGELLWALSVGRRQEPGQDDLEELDVEDQGRVRRNGARETALTIGQFGWDDEPADAARAHSREAFVPPADDLSGAEYEAVGLAAVDRAVEAGAVGETPDVVDDDLDPALRGGAVAPHQILNDEPRIQGLGWDREPHAAGPDRARQDQDGES